MQLLLALQRLHGGNRVARLLDGIEHGAVVLGDGGVEIGLFAAQLGAQALAVEDRQAQRRRDAHLARAALQQIIQTQRVQAHKGGQIHIGVEVGPGGFNALRGRFHAPARGNHIGAAA